MRTVLLTGFGPFAGFEINPSERVARELDGRTIADSRVIARVFATATLTIEDDIRRAVDDVRPDAVIAMGLANSRTGLSIERVAINFYDYDGTDAAGRVRRNASLDADGPAARFATLPLDDIKRAWDARGIPGYISNTAGTFCCNQLLYALLGYAATKDTPPPSGFIHLPCLPEQAAAMGAQAVPSMSLELMTHGIEVAIEALV